MTRTNNGLGLACSLVLVRAATPVFSRLDDQPAKELAELQGTWKLNTLEVSGEEGEPLGGKPRLVVKDEKVFYGGSRSARSKSM